jgi:hypothetical protein
MIDSTNNDRHKKYAANGMLKIWDPSSQQVVLTMLMADSTCTPRTTKCVAKDHFTSS